MKKIIIAVMVLSILIIPAIAQEHQTDINSVREKTIYLNTGGKTGHLTYIEQYYSIDKNNASNLTVDQARSYYDADTNNSKMAIKIMRPVDKQGNLYPDSHIRAIATLDDNIILNAWYGNPQEVVNNVNKTPPIQHPELLVALIIVFVVMVVGGIILKRRKTNL